MGDEYFTKCNGEPNEVFRDWAGCHAHLKPNSGRAANEKAAPDASYPDKYASKESAGTSSGSA